MKKSKSKGLWRMAALLFFSCFLAITTFAQQKTLTGTVIGEDGASIPGVTVIVKGTTVGTITDMDGKFSFSAPADAKTLSVSYIGMKSQEITIGNQTSFKVTMAADVFGIDEVVVVGYGTRMKEELTGAVSTVSSEQLKISTAPSVVGRMQGQISGVTVTSANRPGGDATIRIRGIGTINDPNPLYIIDGVPVGPGNNINPNDIESISVLKDASSAAIYGSRGANGVIIITTKKGRQN
ncbi:MAG: TonB-dependent receptor plug domain-containing protein, partial [Bacteroidota bacterium]|nr:TonB-dependent receptor plug domain-containing protein [Bacteroidota bacterium]